jgi:hypothetical protein
MMETTRLNFPVIYPIVPKRNQQFWSTRFFDYYRLEGTLSKNQKLDMSSEEKEQKLIEMQTR